MQNIYIVRAYYQDFPYSPVIKDVAFCESLEKAIKFINECMNDTSFIDYGYEDISVFECVFSELLIHNADLKPIYTKKIS